VKTAHEIVNNSGYPLQIRLEEWIDETYDQHKWKTLAKEHRWVNQETKDDGYIDLILEKRGLDLRLVIECKRIDGSWTFLTPVAQPTTERRIMALLANHAPPSYSWNELRILPDSLEASFCVMETEGKKDSRTLEKLTGELVLSLEHLAIEETGLFRTFIECLSPPSNPSSKMFYLPVIVTTATLQTMAFHPSAVDVKTGKINANESTISPVEYIRFRKNLATTMKNAEKPLYSLADVNRNNDRSAFVVQTESFINFLSRISE
jgi:hypothetical protein